MTLKELIEKQVVDEEKAAVAFRHKIEKVEFDQHRWDLMADLRRIVPTVYGKQDWSKTEEEVQAHEGDHRRSRRLSGSLR